MTHPYSYPPAPAEPRPWWTHPALIVTLLVILPPAGIVLAWLSKWTTGKKILATVLAGLWFLLPFMTSSGQKGYADGKAAATAKPQPTVSAEPTTPASSPTTATPTPTPTPSEEPKMPNLYGSSLADAEKRLPGRSITAVSAYQDVKLGWGYGSWTVCFQSVAPGEPLPVTPMAVHLAERGVPCPTVKDAILHPPTPTPTPTPTPEPTPPPAPEPEPEDDDDSGSSSGGSSSTGGGGSAYYKNCAAARAAGAAPVRRGDPGYGRHLDRDGDGVGCE
ncbi:excalibur calcium-binding domain-containing protein [Streptomyces sp. DSM 116496]|uniref:excalibur calcium-binding domain-containing protein n=1 Tax=Streptomyces stoeckheimensis TaxID=3344656 RepID=UPI0038B314CC